MRHRKMLRFLAVILCVGAPALQADEPKHFDHAGKQHRTLPCAACHVRMDNNPVPKWPAHATCVECHVADFTSGQTAFCAVCHPTPLTDKPAVLPFPDLAQLGIRRFSHRLHLNAEKTGAAVPACKSCHTVQAGGAEEGFPGHSQCYSCHAHEPQQKLSDCRTCHVTRETGVVPVKANSAFTLYKYKHDTHLKQPSVANRCEVCHRISAEESADKPDMLRISTAHGQRHTSFCWTCHDPKREIVCSKCHAKT